MKRFHVPSPFLPDDALDGQVAWAPPASPQDPLAAGDAPAMRAMTDGEIRSFVSTRGFGVLSLADGNHAYGVPLFYGASEDAFYFQTRAGHKTHFLYATTEACLTISSTRGLGEWASVQVIGRLERVDERGRASDALVDVPPPLLWAADDARADGPGGVTTFRLVPTKRFGRYSQPAKPDARERDSRFQ